jgi:hypothetical protein
MDNFDLKKYIAEGKLFEEVNPIWVIDAFEDSADIEQAGPAYKNAVIDIIKSKHPDISDKDLEASIEVMNVTWYNEARSNAKGSEPEEMKVSAEDFADGAIEHYEDIIVFDNNNLAEGKLLKEELIWKIEGESADISDAGPEYRADVESQIKAIHPNISDEDLEKAIDISNDQFYRSAREDNKMDFGSGDRSLSSDDFVKNAVEIYTTDILDEGKLLKEESIKDIENSWHGVIEILYSKDDFIKIMNAEKFEDLEEREQALIGRALKRWERESGKNMNVADYFKAVKNDLTTLSKNL